MYVGLLLAIAATGCSTLLGFDQVTVAGDDTPVVDAPPDLMIDQLAPADCLTRWNTGPVFGPPQLLAALSTAGDEDLPFVTADEKSIYFVRNADLFVADREAATDPFPAATLESDLRVNQTSIEGKVFVNDDRTRAFFSSNQNSNGFDFFRGSRNNPGNNFAIDQLFIDSLNNSNDQVDLFMSADLLHAYYVDQSLIGGGVLFSTRNTVNDNMGSPSTLLALGGSRRSPTLTADEQVIVLESINGGGSTLVYATRPDASAAFSTPQPIPGFDSHTFDGGPHLSTDGCRLYFSSDRGGIGGGHDLYVATML